MNDTRLTHLNQRGEAHMVDVGDKATTSRKAVAEGRITMRAATLEMLRAGAGNKGEALGVARLAGIMAAKRTADLIPLCHPLSLTHIGVEFNFESAPHAVHCIATAATRERTGVEMEALAAVQIALLTLYDMAKSIDRAMEICDVRLVHKSGGKSGEWNRES